MNTRFLRLEDVEVNSIKKTDVVVESFVGSDGNKVISIAYFEDDSLNKRKLNLTRKQVKELNKALAKWLDGKPLDIVE